MRSPIVNTILALSALAALASAHPTGDAANTKILSHDNLTDDFKNATVVGRSRPTSRHDLECRPDGWYDGKSGDLERAVEYIRNERPKGNKDKVPNLPGESGQTAACVGHTKIKWLNDNKGEFELPSWDNVADGAEVIKHYCKEGKGVAGELNHGDHWRVQVYWEDCYMQPGSDW